MNENKLGTDFRTNIKLLDAALRIDKSIDTVGREVSFSNCSAKLYFIDSFISSDMLELLLIFLSRMKKGAPCDAASFAAECMPYGEVSVTDSIEKIEYSVMSGTVCLLVDALSGKALVIDVRKYPSRSIDEPSNDKVLRGARDGFIEAVKPNVCMIRRRIRDTNFTAEKITVGTKSKTDIALCYIEGVADTKYVDNLRKKLENLDVGALTLGHQSLAEALVPSKWYNPFPKFRYTERPDTAAASILEGGVVIITDTSPEAMILPCGIFDFLQEASDYYLPPFTGCYLRILRQIVFFITLVLTPVWYLLIKNPELIPNSLDFIRIKHEYTVPIIAQLLLVEFAIDGLKLASLNTPDTLNNSLSVVGGLILGDFAVQIGWLIPEVIVFMALVAIANFTQPSYELGYAFKFLRMMMLIATALFNIWGFITAVLLVILFVVSNNTVDGSRSYLYPLIPFNKNALKRLLLRVPAKSVDFTRSDRHRKK